MKTNVRLGMAVCLVLALVVGPAAAQEDHGAGQGSHNLRLRANSPAPSDATQSDLAFWGNVAVAGAYDGFRLLDITNPNKPRQISRMVCNGAQGDVSIWGDLVFRSVDAPQSSMNCNSTGATASTPGMFEGIQIFDISNQGNPVRIHSVPTDCGSHTHTLVPDTDNDRVFLYISSYPLGGSALGPNCQQPHGYISIVEVPLSNPQAATVSKYFLDDDTEFGTWLGFTFRACHDISVFTELGLAAGACMSEGQLWDISNPAEPEFIWRYDNPAIQPANVDIFHSASFTWDGKIVGFGDESGGGGGARCVDPNDDQGRAWFVDTETGRELASYKIPRSVSGICTMHNFNFIPRKHGEYTFVAGNYTGGTTVVDVNKLLAGASEAESEIAWATPEDVDVWSSYWYNGDIIVNDHHRGVDIFQLRDGSRATAKKLPYFNPQTQEQVIN